MDIFFLIGITGMLLILLAFFMNQANKWNNDDLIYDVVNLIGSIFLIIYAIPPLSWPFIVLNGVWAVVSLRDVALDLSKQKHRKSGAYKRKN
ncbi:hypothetical protein IT412_03485 [Candidatus Peregrinibacteria bacterium]|nr:hypothetical protein [Candidatus Peregrinibacteria bacterium]